MGCTSSAPNQLAANTNATDKNMKDETRNQKFVTETGDEKISDTENGMNGTKVLPMCDNLEESFQLARNKNLSFVKTASIESETDIRNKIDIGINSTANDSQTDNNVIYYEEKLTTLEEVVDKVVELHTTDSVKTEESHSIKTSQSDEVELEPNIEKQTTYIDNAVTPSKSVNNIQTETNKTNDQPEVASSPSQSESSRATRWEALADIAAELPPSLTVDPITGQIYTISK